MTITGLKHKPLIFLFLGKIPVPRFVPPCVTTWYWFYIAYLPRIREVLFHNVFSWISSYSNSKTSFAYSFMIETLTRVCIYSDLSFTTSERRSVNNTFQRCWLVHREPLLRETRPHPARWLYRSLALRHFTHLF